MAYIYSYIYIYTPRLPGDDLIRVRKRCGPQPMVIGLRAVPPDKSQVVRVRRCSEGETNLFLCTCCREYTIPTFPYDTQTRNENNRCDTVINTYSRAYRIWQANRVGGEGCGGLISRRTPSKLHLICGKTVRVRRRTQPIKYVRMYCVKQIQCWK